MKFQTTLLSSVVAATLMLASAGSKADSTYGHNAAGTGPVSATANVKITVKIPLLVLLRVGSAGATIDEITFTAAPSTPTGITADGNSQAITWDGAAPVFVATAAPSATLTSYGWTNAKDGAKLTCSQTNNFPATGLTTASITIANAGTGTLNHPGADTACAAASTTNFSANTVASSTWTYAVAPAALAAAPAGSYSQDIVYTATTL